MALLELGLMVMLHTLLCLSYVAHKSNPTNNLIRNKEEQRPICFVTKSDTNSDRILPVNPAKYETRLQMQAITREPRGLFLAKTPRTTTTKLLVDSTSLRGSRGKSTIFMFSLPN